MAKKKIEVDMTMKKKKNPYIIGGLIILLVGAIGYAGYGAYKYFDKPEEVTVKEPKKVNTSGYKEVDSKVKENMPVELKDFVNKNKDKKGAYSFQGEKNTYVLLTAGKITDGKGYSIQFEPPTYDKEKKKATIVYNFTEFEADEFQEGNEPDYVLLTLDKVDSVTTMKTSDKIVITK